MGWINLLLAGVAGFAAKSALQDSAEQKEREREETKRKNTPYHYSALITLEEFYAIVETATSEVSRKIKRHINVNIDGLVVYGTVESIKGLSTWSFTLDFNDYGHITGKYWLITTNSDSLVPGNLAQRIQEMVKTQLTGEGVPATLSVHKEGPEKVIYCQSCMSVISNPNAKFCGYCGSQLRRN